MNNSNLLNDIYRILNQKKKELIASVKQSGYLSTCGYYSQHSIRTTDGWRTEEYPIPVVTIQEVGDVGFDLEQIFFEVVISKDRALCLDFSKFAQYSFDVYGVENYLNDFYTKSMECNLIRERISQSNEEKIGICFYFANEVSMNDLWKSVLSITRRLGKE